MQAAPGPLMLAIHGDQPSIPGQSVALLYNKMSNFPSAVVVRLVSASPENLVMVLTTVVFSSMVWAVNRTLSDLAMSGKTLLSGMHLRRLV